MVTRDVISDDAAGIFAVPLAVPLEYERAGDVQAVLDGLWLIDGVLPKMGVAAVYGHPGCGKTFLAMDWAAHVSGGTKWNDCHVEQGLVVYVVAEGQTGFRNRLVAMREAGRYTRGDPFVFIPSPIDLQAADGDTEDLIETIRAVADREDARAALIVIDTLSKTFGAGKENSDDMATYLANCQRVASAFDCLTLIVHHRPKDSESRDLRGHGSLRGGIDTAVIVEGDEVRRATVVKQKDGEEGLQWRFALDRTVLGINSRGGEVSTCLVRYLSEQPHSDLDKVAQAQGDNALFLRCLEERNRQQRAVSEKRGPTYAPTEFAMMPESKGIGKARLELAMDRLFRVGQIERAELWKNEHRRAVIGLRQTRQTVSETAEMRAANTVRQTRQTVPEPAEMRAANAANTHSPPKGGGGSPPDGAKPPLGDEEAPVGW